MSIPNDESTSTATFDDDFDEAAIAAGFNEDELDIDADDSTTSVAETEDTDADSGTETETTQTADTETVETVPTATVTPQTASQSPYNNLTELDQAYDISLEELTQKYDESELSTTEFQKEIVKLDRLRDAHKEAINHRTATVNAEINHFFTEHPDLNDEMVLDAMNGEIARMRRDPKNANKPLTFFLESAAEKVSAKFNLGFKSKTAALKEQRNQRLKGNISIKGSKSNPEKTELDGMTIAQKAYLE